MEKTMTVEILCVGTELLLGNIVNTNAAYLARKCAALGLSCNYQTVVGDNESCLAQAIECAVKRSDVLMISGGLSLAENIQKKNIKADKTVVMENENGPSRGFLIETEECKIIMLPGSPNELAAMFEKNIIPYLEKLTSGVIYSQTVKICGIEESEVTERIKDLVENQTNLTVTLYPMTGEVHVRVLAVSEDMKQAKKLIKPVVKELKARFGYNVYTTEEDTTLEKAVVELLIAND
ncbi:MAG: competence/damage-inducible protein A, partial [Acetatifactor sp.]|nr:competence/damage-inducible protein A [Acetatifactor sp.]